MSRLTALCLDGPLNGSWADFDNPPEGYTPEHWPSGEQVLLYLSYETRIWWDDEQS